jgi:hypothetical protein
MVLGRAGVRAWVLAERYPAEGVGGVSLGARRKDYWEDLGVGLVVWGARSGGDVFCVWV